MSDPAQALIRERVIDSLELFVDTMCYRDMPLSDAPLTLGVNMKSKLKLPGVFGQSAVTITQVRGGIDRDC